MNEMTASAIPDLALMQSIDRRVVASFTSAGFEQIEPAVMQPADVYLQQIGEAIRGRTYVFTDIDGEELCLRPDLTVPAARVYIERQQELGEKARVCYSGTAFRYPYDGPAHGNAREFRQAGIEIFGKEDAEKAEAEVLSYTIAALTEIGVTDYTIRLGDLGLFYALLEAIEMPVRWRKRLSENFWRKNEFSKILKRLGEPNNHEYQKDLAALLRKITDENQKEAENHVGKYLADRNIPLIGARSLTEITNQLITKASDLIAEPLAAEKIELIDRYLEISAPPKAVGARLQDLASNAGLDITQALDRYQKRIEWLSKMNVDLSHAEFTADFGRQIEYYTGFVFQVEKQNMGVEGHLAGGGRYNNLLKNLGLSRKTPAIGAAIHLDRLAALNEGATT
ncbi:MAG: ATP phosphoribosyltransferase regulatory subunit [Rhodomicrobium sp.]|nr:MAG: ATP phosphoribosyltransferase regulatory subunit [Rhodomicrobium sp.]